MRTSQLESVINESVKDGAINELKDELSYWLETDDSQKLMQLRKSIMTYSKRGVFEDLVEDIEMNDADAAAYYHNLCGDNLYECDEFDEKLFQKSYSELIEYFNVKGNAKIILTSSFWKHKGDKIINL